MPLVNVDGVEIEIPRHVKKPGAYKVVSTEQELRDALADGWKLRLKEPVVPAEDAPPASPETPESPKETPADFVAHIAGLSAKDAIAEIEACEDVAALKALAKAEERATVERAIEKRLEELSA